MNISEELLKQWEKLQSPGDAEKIAAMAKPPISGETVRRALRFRKCSDEVFTLLCAYYKKKAQLVIDEASDPVLIEANQILSDAEQVD